jgi:undecaprenyl pyrophosphate phosphatase UppP
LKDSVGILRLGSNIGHGLFVGWVESAGGGLGFSVGGPTYLPAIFVLSAKPNKMAEDRIIPEFCIMTNIALIFSQTEIMTGISESK